MIKYVTSPLTREQWLTKYAPDWVKEESAPASSDMCTQCRANAKSHNKKWPPCGNMKTGRAALNHLFQLEALTDAGAFEAFSPEQRLEMHLQSDPVAWAISEFTIDGKPWVPRWYQEIFMRCSATKRAALWGRRSGKSECMLVLCLWAARYRIGEVGTDREYYIHIFVNSEQLANKHYDEMMKFINASRTMNHMKASVQKGKRIQLTNNVTISFNVLSMKQVGQDAHFIWFDEAAFYESDEAFAHASAIKLSRPQTPIIMTSNSSGFRGKFYEFCHQDDTYLLQLPSYVNPDWDFEQENFARQNYNSFEYDILIKAEWGQAQSGVFKVEDIERSLNNFQYSYTQCSPVKAPGAFRVLGNDWNESANGVHFVIVEYNPAWQPLGRPVFKTIHKEVVTGNEFNHEVAIAKAKQLMIGWSCNAAFLDAGGGGSLSVERLRLMLQQEGHFKTAKHVYGIPMASKLPVPDNDGGETLKYAKNLITNVCQIMCENGQLAWPVEEAPDNSTLDKSHNIIPQMRAYKVAKWDSTGRAIYESEIDIDHTLTAWMLAVYGCVVNSSTNLVAGAKIPDASYVVEREPLPSETQKPAVGSSSENNANKEQVTFGMPTVNRGLGIGWNPRTGNNRTSKFGGASGGRKKW